LSRRLAVFDCDGTLVDSQANIVAAMAHCFAVHGLPDPDPVAVRRIVGLSLIEAMQALLPGAPDEQHRALAEDYKSAFRTLRGNGGLAEEPLFDGIVESLDAFAADGWLLGIATGKSDRGLALILDHHRLTGRFVTLQTADRHPSKPHPAMIHAAIAEAGARPETSVMIGDTSFDMAMGVAAGVRSIGVAWGYHAPDELRDAGALAVADHARDLARLANGTY
jgi:phosphoglycolate phosphatase